MTFLSNGIRYKVSVLHSTEDVDTNVHSNLNKNEWLQRENSRLEIKKALWKNCVLRNTIKIQKFVFHRTEYLKMITSYIWIFMRYSRFKVAFNRIILYSSLQMISMISAVNYWIPINTICWVCSVIVIYILFKIFSHLCWTEYSWFMWEIIEME